MQKTLTYYHTIYGSVKESHSGSRLRAELLPMLKSTTIWDPSESDALG